MYRSIVHIAILIAFFSSAGAETTQENAIKKPEANNHIMNKILEFRSDNDGISYEYIDFEDDTTDDEDEDEEILLQDESDNASPLGRLMTT